MEPLVSSPVAYPPSSSPLQPAKSRKRNRSKGPTWSGKRKSFGCNARDISDLQESELFAETSLSMDMQSLPYAHASKILKGPFIDEDDDEPRVMDSSPPKGQAPPLVGDEPQGLGDTSVIRRIDKSSDVAPRAMNSSGRTFHLRYKARRTPLSYEKLIAARSTIASPGKATKAFYGVDIHNLIAQSEGKTKCPRTRSEADIETSSPFGKGPGLSRAAQKRADMLWTEKYRARKFTDLVGDERTHREVLRWLKRWDKIVFPGSTNSKPVRTLNGEEDDVQRHRKILMLTGHPGLGKTTLAHVCARQAGYEVVEVNASDERTSQVVKGRIKDCVGTENVKGVSTTTGQGKVRKAGRPVCVIVDEIDGVASGNGSSGEGGFVKALADLVALDHKNSDVLTTASGNAMKSKEKANRFRLLRPLILICNDVYHPSLRLLRTSNIAEIIHIRMPPIDKVVSRLKSVFEKEGLPCDGDGARRLCELTWGVNSRREYRSKASGEGDMRGILVVGELAASKLRTSPKGPLRLTRKWVEENMTGGFACGSGSARGFGRGGVREAVERVFMNGAGLMEMPFSAPMDDRFVAASDGGIGVAEAAKKTAMDGLRELIDTSGESDRIVMGCFASYPSHPFQDDTLLSKPNAACDWLHLHDLFSSRISTGQGWELASYLSHPILGLHHLFASPARRDWNDREHVEDEPLPFSGPRADYAAAEALKQNKAILQALQSSLSIPLMQCFRSAEDISTDLLPHLMVMLTPNVNPIIVGGIGNHAGVVTVRKEAEQSMIERAVSIMGAVGVVFERVRIDTGRNGVINYIYRMEP